MRVAVVGAGVSGLGAAWALRDVADVTLFEGEPRLGGHAHTVSIDYDGVRIDVDTGFIVYNEKNYPNLVGLFDALEVETIASDMSFSVSDPMGFEWSSNGLSGIFAWKRNMTRPAFLCMLGDIVRFSTAARADLADPRLERASLAEYVDGLKLGRGFLRQYLLPMGAAIWSTPEREMMNYPAASFLRFFDNHRLLHAKRPQWRTVKDGSRAYVERLASSLAGRIRKGDPVNRVTRVGGGVVVQTQAGFEGRFDHVILACHSDQALALLSDARPQEAALLGAVRYAPNTAYLHRDRTLMPKRKAAWASWNYLRSPKGEALGGDSAVTVSYWMNRLQTLDDARPLFVTLNPTTPPDPSLTFAQFSYDHPQFDRAAIQAQRAMHEIQGREGVWFAGAWMGYGFHEDGLAAGLAAAEALGGQAPWRRAPVRGAQALHAAPAPLSAAAH